MRLKISVLSLSFFIGGCTSTGTKDIVQVGKDTYLLARPGGFFAISGGEVKAQLYRDANNFCQSQSKHLQPVSTSSRDSAPYQYANAELQFRCLSENDPLYQRPNMERAPDVVIKNQ